MVNYEARLGELLVSEEMDKRGLASIAVVDPAALNPDTAGPSKKLLALIGLCAALAAGIATIVLSHQLSPGLGTAAQTAREMGLPVLVTFDRTRRRSA